MPSSWMGRCRCTYRQARDRTNIAGIRSAMRSHCHPLPKTKDAGNVAAILERFDRIVQVILRLLLGHIG